MPVGSADADAQRVEYHADIIQIFAVQGFVVLPEADLQVAEFALHIKEVAAYRQRGIAALAHGNRGRQPANRISEAVRQDILRLAKETYQDYNDCHFTEELAEQDELIVALHILVSSSKIRANHNQIILSILLHSADYWDVFDLSHYKG
jgi:hypothetical protein